ncbi:hypothetical protein ASPWEDRAFT_397679 [Aspergillus wentii DTO 134E9]|uniref:Uncharacterized protein n=1 Tax=Aspergillus wentii DTO 134E9 TaxID=1073089 RepID=A0A1L9RY22_ASPWE|nr:uncharacterized protein ASPWEDRAFT_397679 [Aspergillus wentii DTO 134E9]OJJ39851.1 hypothetical protein ASPWEDRAFT_397679 [Aspergillus wentii DTO 134E9]
MCGSLPSHLFPLYNRFPFPIHLYQRPSLLLVFGELRTRQRPHRCLHRRRLLILGVSDEDIIADYCLSAEGTKLLLPQRKEKIAQFLRDQSVSFTSVALDGHFSALPDTMALFLGRFRAIYGGREGSMRHIGLEMGDVRVIMENLTAWWQLLGYDFVSTLLNAAETTPNNRHPLPG